MSNYKWIKMSDNYVELRKEDFSSVPSFEVNEIDPILMKKLEENEIDHWLEGDSFLEACRYVLSAIDRKFVTITAPLYEYDLNSGEFVLLSEAYTDWIYVKFLDTFFYEFIFSFKLRLRSCYKY